MHSYSVAVIDRQRVVLVIGLGLAIAAVMRTIDLRLSSYANGGWFAYAPNTEPIFSNHDADIWRSGILWLAGVLAWTGASMWIWRGPKDHRGTNV